MVWPLLLHYKYPKLEFNIGGIKFLQHKAKNEKAPSTWTGEFVKNGYSFTKMDKRTKFYTHRFKEGNFVIDKQACAKAMEKYDWYQKAIFMGWCTKEDYDNYMSQFK